MDLFFSEKYSCTKEPWGHMWVPHSDGRLSKSDSFMLGRDVPLWTGVPFSRRQDYIPTTPFTGSPFCRLSAWVDSPVVWALPASAPESGFLLGPESAPLFSALTTWTNPELINHLCWSHLSCSAAIFCFSGCDYDPGPYHAGLVWIKKIILLESSHCGQYEDTLPIDATCFIMFVVVDIVCLNIFSSTA